MAQAKKDPAAVRAKGLMFAAGVIASMLVLAGVLLGLRAGGEQIGWGFQLQSPLFVTFMIYLLLAVGLNLSGVFEVGGGLAGVGDSLTHGDGLRASFFTGVLTTLVATPCTAPFMAAAVGAALTQSPVVALCIFAALGAGLSLPYLAVVLRALAAAGAAEARRVDGHDEADLCVPDVCLGRVASVGAGPADLLARPRCGPCRCLAGRVRGVGVPEIQGQLGRGTIDGDRHRRGGGAARDCAARALGERRNRRAGRCAVSSGERAGSRTMPRACRALEASGAPLLVNFTASWCLTCLVNERNAFADPAVARSSARRASR